MNIFDIMGPIMVGPSSSHTAGAARIGYTFTCSAEMNSACAEALPPAKRSHAPQARGAPAPDDGPAEA